jgi:thiamine biosynthesis lipoprotein
MTHVQRFRSMGCDIVVGGAAPSELRAIEQLFAERDRRFSRFRDDSELSRVNASVAPVMVSQNFTSALNVALEAAAATDGLVDPTLGAAVESAGYDRDFADLDRQAESRPRPRPSAGRWQSVRLSGRLLARPRDVRLDLNGVVKALAVDDALTCIAGTGFVSAGGDLATSGPVNVAVPGGDVVQVLEGGVATSGSVRRRWTRGGVEQHHLIDPRTGLPCRSPWTQVTVVGASCLAADVCAKAAFLLGADGPAWLDSRALPGQFVSHDRVLCNRTWSAALTRETACI